MTDTQQLVAAAQALLAGDAEAAKALLERPAWAQYAVWQAVVDTNPDILWCASGELNDAFRLYTPGGRKFFVAHEAAVQEAQREMKSFSTLDDKITCAMLRLAEIEESIP